MTEEQITVLGVTLAHILATPPGERSIEQTAALDAAIPALLLEAEDAVHARAEIVLLRAAIAAPALKEIEQTKVRLESIAGLSGGLSVKTTRGGTDDDNETGA